MYLLTIKDFFSNEILWEGEVSKMHYANGHVNDHSEVYEYTPL